MLWPNHSRKLGNYERIRRTWFAQSEERRTEIARLIRERAVRQVGFYEDDITHRVRAVENPFQNSLDDLDPEVNLADLPVPLIHLPKKRCRFVLDSSRYGSYASAGGPSSSSIGRPTSPTLAAVFQSRKNNDADVNVDKYVILWDRGDDMWLPYDISFEEFSDRVMLEKYEMLWYSFRGQSEVIFDSPEDYKKFLEAVRAHHNCVMIRPWTEADEESQ
jgi:hypothetical protein